MEVTQSDLALDCVYRWERERADRIFLTQPFGGGPVRQWTWAQAVGEARRMAAYLKAQDWEPGPGSPSSARIAPGGSWPTSRSGWPATSAYPSILPCGRNPSATFWSTASARLLSRRHRRARGRRVRHSARHYLDRFPNAPKRAMSAGNPLSKRIRPSRLAVRKRTTSPRLFIHRAPPALRKA